ncbi:MAG: hypothetical protein KDD61_04940 [Bdellovibrionales bacterium]|nr:hypothetical protein [Bdellovibrionales bacterium]
MNKNVISLLNLSLTSALIFLTVGCSPDQSRSYFRKAAEGAKSAKAQGAANDNSYISTFTVDKDRKVTKDGKMKCLNLQKTIESLVTSVGVTGKNDATTKKSNTSVEAVHYVRSIQFKKSANNVSYENLESLNGEKILPEFLRKNPSSPTLTYLSDFFTSSRWPLGAVKQNDCTTVSASFVNDADTVENINYTIVDANSTRLVLESQSSNIILAFVGTQMVSTVIRKLPVLSTCDQDSFTTSPVLQEVSVVLQWGGKVKSPASIDFEIASALASIKKRIPQTLNTIIESHKNQGSRLVSIPLDTLNLTFDATDANNDANKCI